MSQSAVNSRHSPAVVVNTATTHTIPGSGEHAVKCANSSIILTAYFECTNARARTNRIFHAHLAHYARRGVTAARPGGAIALRHLCGTREIALRCHYFTYLNCQIVQLGAGGGDSARPGLVTGTANGGGRGGDLNKSGLRISRQARRAEADSRCISPAG
ncbi:hypothetical protein J6590_016931 [Homalodisca vitripennis]|nr:hypothetical protein J6590_016931 [Homalodisca vitripennis]